jgi:uncharacterized protein (DUF488 family)
MRTLYTIGYQGATPERVIGRLEASSVTLLVDVRERTASRKPGFSKTALAASLEASGVSYEHWRQLGTPKAIRDLLHESGDWKAYEVAYLERLAGQYELLERLGERAAHEVACLLCFERDAHGCHRSLVAGRLRERGLVDAVEHLQALEVAAVTGS